MKKSIIRTILYLSFSFHALTVCASEESTVDMAASEIVQEFVDAGFPIDHIIVYDESSDPNNLLGRPDQYTSKVNFADTRCEQYDTSDPIGGTIEVFTDAADAQARYDYVSGFTSLTQQYFYLQDNVFMRISYDLLPSEAAEYEAGLTAITEGTDFPAFEETISTADSTNTTETSVSIPDVSDVSEEYETLQSEYNSLTDTYQALSSEHELLQADYDTLLAEKETLQTNYDTLFAEHEQCAAEPVITEIEFTSDSLLNAEEVFHQLSDDDLQYIIDNAQKELDSRKNLSSAETDNEDFGNWKINYYVDQFDLPTDEAYISYNTSFNGIFSNSATTDSLLSAKLLIDDRIAIMLYEYGDQKVTSYSDTDYTIYMLDSSDNKTYIAGTMYENSDRIFIHTSYMDLILDALKEGGEISFYLEQKDRSIVNYLFMIPDASGFDKVYNSLDFTE